MSPACHEPMTRSPDAGDQPHRAVGVDAAEPVRVADGAGGNRGGACRTGAWGRGAAVRAGVRVWAWAAALARLAGRHIRYLVPSARCISAHLPRNAAPRIAVSISKAIETGRRAPCPRLCSGDLPRLVRTTSGGRSMAKADIAALLALGAAFFIAIGDVIHQRSAHEVTDEPVGHIGAVHCACCATAGGGWAAWWPPPDSRCRPRRSAWARCCWCRRCWSPRCCSRCRSTRD